MIITEIFRKDYTSIENFHVAHGFYIRAIISTGRRTAGGRCEPSARERSLWMYHSVLPDETNKQQNLRKVRNQLPPRYKHVSFL